MNSDLSLKRMGVWTMDGRRQMNRKEIKEKVHKGRRDRKKEWKGKCGIWRDLSLWECAGDRKRTPTAAHNLQLENS